MSLKDWSPAPLLARLRGDRGAEPAAPPPDTSPEKAPALAGATTDA
jgi:hypothetical protein